MKHFDKNTQKGIIKQLILIMAAVILFAYFRKDIMAFFGSPKFKEALLISSNWIQVALVWIGGKIAWATNQIK